MILITSAAYVEGDFSAEVGLLPPSFLPIGNKRLYQHQIKFFQEFGQGEKLYLSIPSSFVLDSYDERQLNDLGVNILRVPDGLSLGDSILYCWNATAQHHDTLSLLHGDTLFLDFDPIGADAISVHKNHGYYRRARVGSPVGVLGQLESRWASDDEKVISGFFSFNNPLYFMKSLVECKGDFVDAISSYHNEFPLATLDDGLWLDFGHINSYFHSRRLMTTQRSFNDLKINARSVEKRSTQNPSKIYAEASWFADLPMPLRIYTPPLIGFHDNSGRLDEEFSYELEYLYLVPLNDLWVFGRLTPSTWKPIISSIKNMLVGFSEFRPCEENDWPVFSELDGLYLDKTTRRLKQYSEEAGVSVFERKVVLSSGEFVSLMEIAENSAAHIKPVTRDDICLVHGDPCFSNLLFDSRVESVKCIDPRGMLPSGKVSLYGDRRYDLAKLYHSILGGYDSIVAARYDILGDTLCAQNLYIYHDDKLVEAVCEYFSENILVDMGYSAKEILAIVVHLFLSMLPLHSDAPDRQHAFVLNAIRLYEILETH